MTDSDLSLFGEVVGPEFADRARAKRQGFVAPTEPEHRDKTPVTRGYLLKALERVVLDDLMPIMATYRYRIDELTKRVAELEQQSPPRYSSASHTLPDISDLVQ